MKIAIVTGSAGLIGSEAVGFFAKKMDKVIGIDSNHRAYFFGANASTEWNKKKLEQTIPNYIHHTADIRDYETMENIFSEYGKDISIVIHAAAQPSHDWAAKEPMTDFTINANGTIHLLELTRLYAPKAVFIFTSTNKVYGDTPNRLPLIELEDRWEIAETHPYYKQGIDESMSIDNCKHSIFGVSKVAADIAAQEYGKYFGMNVGIFRCGCLTGPQHAGTELHGFLSYLMRCAIKDEHYTVFGYNGKQVRDNIHSSDLINMFWHFYQSPHKGEVYNAGGGRFANCSMKEAIRFCEKITGKKMNVTLTNDNRIGDHIWYISDISKFREHYPGWEYQYDLQDTLIQIHDSMKERV